jgi:hypothetical protein
MKLRYILVSVIAALTFAVGCEKEADHYLDEVKLSSSYVAIPQSGGSTSVKIDATGSWSVTKAPSWLTVSPTSGGAGSSNIAFSADNTINGRSGEVILSCNGKEQHINVIQGLATVSKATCAEVIAGPESKTYRVTGVCTSIANTSYGNWYLTDDTGTIYIYGTVDGTGKYNWSSFNIEVGDVVTVEGPKTVYNGTVELVDAVFVSVQKSLVKIAEGSAASFDANGGSFEVKVLAKGNGPTISIPEDAQSWISMSSVKMVGDTTVVNFNVAPNTEESARSAAISFTSKSGKNSSTVSATVDQMGLSGTLTNPFTVADAIAYCQTLSGNSGNEFYVKGKISHIIKNGTFSAQYGNATFYISDDGEYLGTDDKNCDKTHDFEAYRVLFLNNQKWVDGNAQIAVGDEVIIHGILTLYNGISETASGKAYIYSINGVTSDENGVGNLEAPFNVAGAEACIDNGFAGDVFVKGIVSEIANNGQFGAQYGNGTFWISDDGTKYGDSAKDFEAYRVYWLGNRKWEEGDDPIAVGDEVILHGQLTKYKTTYETVQNKAYVYSVNGKTE